MKRKAIAGIAVLGLVAAGLVLAVRGVGLLRARLSGAGQERVTVTSPSPDGRLRVRVVEVWAGMIDRNFEVRIEDVATGTMRTVFLSPDEGRPEGTERIIWAADGSRFVLVGRHFYADAPRLPSGESLYLMHDVATGRTWCNSKQQAAAPAFSWGDVEGIRWKEPLGPVAQPAVEREHDDAP